VYIVLKGSEKMREIKVIKNILKFNEEASNNNKQIFDENGVYVVNLMSSPGSGKTSILEKIINMLKSEVNIAVIEGDIYTIKDAERIQNQGIPVVQINTEGACHLDARMIKRAADELDLGNTELLVIENVGNLVCPAEFEVGEDIKISVLSTTEGSDKPSKYPLMFEKSGAVVLNKIDLIDYTNFSREEFYGDLKALNERVQVFETSCIKNEGIDKLCDFLKDAMKKKSSN
jgi:hydrogenase nickel incorporation protein HypB